MLNNECGRCSQFERCAVLVLAITVKVKVKFTLEQALKAQRGSKV